MEEKTKVRALYDELVVENAMTGEVVRHMRKAWRGSSPGSVIANIVVAGMLAVLYVNAMVWIVKWDLVIAQIIQIVELLAITLVAPSSIYAAISGEREKSTWDALVLTRLTAAQIIAGKLVWRLALLAGIMVLMVLMVLVSQTQGGVLDRPTAAAVLLAQIIILAWGLLLSAFGLWVSAKTARSVTSIGVILATVLATLLMLPALLAAFGANLNPGASMSGLDTLGVAVMALNPFVLVVSLGEGRTISSNLYGDPSWCIAAAAIYIVGAAYFLWRTHFAVKCLSGE